MIIEFFKLMDTLDSILKMCVFNSTTARMKIYEDYEVICTKRNDGSYSASIIKGNTPTNLLTIVSTPVERYSSISWSEIGNLGAYVCIRGNGGDSDELQVKSENGITVIDVCDIDLRSSDIEPTLFQLSTIHDDNFLLYYTIISHYVLHGKDVQSVYVRNAIPSGELQNLIEGAKEMLEKL